MQPRLLPAMFCTGVAAAVTQVLLTREMLVAFLGNELSIGVILASWLICVGLGALLARILRLTHLRDPVLVAGLAAATLALGLALPAQVWAIRSARLLLGVAAGEYMPLSGILLSAAITVLPSGLCIGIIFPLACEWHVRRAGAGASPARAVSSIYTLESLGGMLGGAAMTFLLLPAATPIQIMSVSVAVAALGAWCLGTRPPARAALAALALALMTVAAVCPGWYQDLELRAVERRWKAFGVLSDAAAGAEATRLVKETDTIYQNLALTEAAGQYTLYADGRVAENHAAFARAWNSIA